MSDITEGQLDRLDKDQLFLAYRQSHATVSYLKSRFSSRHLARYLREIASGTDPETAVRRVFRRSYKTLQLETADFIGQG